MDYKELFHKYKEKGKDLWQTGKIQRYSRITYDVLWNVILFFLVIGFIGVFFAGGIGMGYFASLVKEEPIRSYESMEKDIYNYEETSKLYFADNNYFGDVRSDLHREETTLDNISDTLIDAVIATEDEYFEEHNGIVPKAIVRAVVQEATNAEMKSGGSTLTQQLIKNQILTNEVSFERKAKEILLAMRLERFFEKDQILEAYLNIVPYGREASGQNIAGIQTAAQGIFGIDAKNVNLAQAAYLAGLPQSPSRYTPFANGGGLKDEEGLQPGINRMKTVLNRMLEAGYINQEEYEEAINYDIVADFTEESTSPVEEYPYVMHEAEKRAINIIADMLAEEDGYTREDLEEDEVLKEEYEILAERDIRRNGYNVHTTIDKEIYDTFQEIVKEYEYFGPDWTGDVENPETGEMEETTLPIRTGGMLIENSTGRIISFVGGRDYEDSEINYATQATRSNGSTMKPLLSYGPGMEAGVVQPGTPIADVKEVIHYPGGSWDLSNYGGGNYGIVSARTALANSYNIPAGKVYLEIMNDNPVEQYLEKMGITSLEENEYANPSLSIGGTKHGVTVEENTNAFASFSNGGQFVDAYMIEKITTNEGETVYEHESDPVDVFSPQTAYLTLDLMRDVIRRGTGTYLNSQLAHTGVDWAGKTGTSQDYKDAWFVATNPNVTFGTWIGYDLEKSIRCSNCSLSYSQRNIKLWAELINAATDINPDLFAPQENFERPSGIVERSYCQISGMLPSDLCQEAGLVATDLFNEKFVPTKEDDSLIRGTYVLVDGKAVVAGPNTPAEFTDGDGLTFNPEFLERMGYDKYNDISVLFPRTNREAWENISVPSEELGATLEDDGDGPAEPSSVRHSNSTLSWGQSSSNDVVGYRIFRADQRDGDFELIGNTTGTSYSVPNRNAIYHVKAVDYFGLESSPSNAVVVGELSSDNDNNNDDEDDRRNNNGNKNNNNNENNNNGNGNNGNQSNDGNSQSEDKEEEENENPENENDKSDKNEESEQKNNDN
ncbi:transglycosylase domain-containing protein [Oceanobacillus halotolerans]|uniref:transglycosylase domain-containing protein n=1 Tax=Oceanobacillus halotolerans TaxID=2663380 RepID=UPI0013DD4E40|nr:transglycosylase domain-containing protein [Oceanobacillus halotolerans]